MIPAVFAKSYRHFFFVAGFCLHLFPFCLVGPRVLGREHIVQVLPAPDDKQSVELPLLIRENSMVRVPAPPTGDANAHLQIEGYATSSAAADTLALQQLEQAVEPRTVVETAEEMAERVQEAQVGHGLLWFC